MLAAYNRGRLGKCQRARRYGQYCMEHGKRRDREEPWDAGYDLLRYYPGDNADDPGIPDPLRGA